MSMLRVILRYLICPLFSHWRHSQQKVYEYVTTPTFSLVSNANMLASTIFLINIVYAVCYDGPFGSGRVTGVSVNSPFGTGRIINSRSDDPFVGSGSGPSSNWDNRSHSPPTVGWIVLGVGLVIIIVIISMVIFKFKPWKACASNPREDTMREVLTTRGEGRPIGMTPARPAQTPSRSNYASATAHVESDEPPKYDDLYKY